MERMALCPDVVFKNQFPGWGEFLGTGKPRPNTVESNVRLAEKIASENGGILPCNAWLRKRGHRRVANATWKYPDRFAHIPREKVIRSPEEWLSVAIELSHKNGGLLPCVKWLRTHGYAGLDGVMRSHPVLFGPIDQERKRCRHVRHKVEPEAMVALAKQLACENGGCFPNREWLEKHGYKVLRNAITNHPDLFKGIKWNRRNKTPEEWLDIAIKLAESNKGKLQSSRWLQLNGYGGLDQAIRKNPVLFGGIEQEWRGRGSRAIFKKRESP